MSSPLSARKHCTTSSAGAAGNPAVRRDRWRSITLRREANRWFRQMREQYHKRSAPASDWAWWSFGPRWLRYRENVIQALIQGHYRFEPMRRLHFKPEPGEKSTVDHHPMIWSYSDRLAVRLIHRIIKPSFQYIIPPETFHLAGIGAVSKAISATEEALSTGAYRYVIRADIANFYASIDRDILMAQLKEVFHDPYLLPLLEAVVYHSIDDGGVVTTPRKGIPRRSSLSPFFGALYLLPLVRALTQKGSCKVMLYMDDLVVLTSNRRQHRWAQQRLHRACATLQLSLSSRKTWIGAWGEKGFHFLGVHFSASQNQKRQTQSKAVIRLHDRSCLRALAQAQAYSTYAVNPAILVSYLRRWALWWSRASDQLTEREVLAQWCRIAYQAGAPPPIHAIGWAALAQVERQLPRGTT